LSKRTLSNTTPTWRYRLCLRLVSPLLLLHLSWRSIRDGGKQYFLERLGFSSKDQIKRIHIHAASVGEVITVLPLVEKMQAKYPSLAFLITTNTPTGFNILKARCSANSIQAFLPIDFAGATKRFYNSKTITSLLVVETEIWPWLYFRANQRNIPITIINARLSPKSNGAVASFFSQTYTKALSTVSVLARSKDDADRYAAKGVQPSKPTAVNPIKLIEQDYVLAASTHDDEELQLAQAWLATTSEQLLVIAPRHAERGARLAKSLNALQKEIDPALPIIAVRSQGQQPTPQSKIYLADTLGELNDWYAHATAAFVGGSLIKRGGHNVLEPARYATPIIVGPHTFNFKKEVQLLFDEQAIAVADNVDEVVQLMVLAGSNEDWCNAIGSRAKNIINVQSDVLDKYIESLEETVTQSLHIKV